VRGDELARRHLILRSVDGVDGDEFAAAQVAGAEAARRGRAARHHRVISLAHADDDELQVVLI